MAYFNGSVRNISIAKYINQRVIPWPVERMRGRKKLNERNKEKEGDVFDMSAEPALSSVTQKYRPLPNRSAMYSLYTTSPAYRCHSCKYCFQFNACHALCLLSAFPRYFCINYKWIHWSSPLWKWTVFLTGLIGDALFI